jgi:hypothetical protein
VLAAAEQTSEMALIAQAAAFSATQPRYLQPVPYTSVPEGLSSLTAESCGSCHSAIYDEWRVSTHARAWTDDAQFMAELNKPREGSGDVRWMCINCHTPLVNQQENLVLGVRDGRLDRPNLVENPHYDAALQQDAITCATCHVRDGVVLGPRGDSDAPHPVRPAPTLLTSEVCTQCHQAEASFPDLTLACVFNTGNEVAEGPYGQSGATCQSCHMPSVERPSVAGGTLVRSTRRHWFGGSLIPKHPDFEAEIAPLRDVYPDGLRADWVSLPASVEPGSTVSLTFEAQNVAAGHMLPTGDPERYMLVSATATAADGTVLASSEQRIGQTYEWYPEVRQVADNRLAPLESRQWTLEFVAPPDGVVTLHLEASKWRISPENLAYHDLEGRYVAGRVFVDETATLTVAP